LFIFGCTDDHAGRLLIDGNYFCRLATQVLQSLRWWGVLIEVPVMLSVCSVCNRTRHWFPAAA